MIVKTLIVVLELISIDSKDFDNETEKKKNLERLRYNSKWVTTLEVRQWAGLVKLGVEGRILDSRDENNLR